MALHISSDQVVDYLLSATSISVDGQVYKTFSKDSDSFIIGPVKLPLTYFDIGGLNSTMIILMDYDKKLRKVMALGKDGLVIPFPEWTTEPYDPEKVRNRHLLKRD
jgi:hypothetical protein